MMQLLRLERKRSSDESDVHENFPNCRITDVADRVSFDQSARKILFSYDCQTILFYENQEGTFRDLAEREGFWDIESPSSPDETKATETPTSTIEIEEITPRKRKKEATRPETTKRVSSLSASPISFLNNSSIALYAPKNSKVEKKKKPLQKVSKTFGT